MTPPQENLPEKSLSEAFKKAKQIAADTLGLLGHAKLVPFDGLEFTDPWLEWWLDKKGPTKPSRIFMLQDWGNVKNYNLDTGGSTTRRDRVRLVERYLGSREDPTCRALIDKLHLARLSETTLIMNAVWGLRPSDDRVTGYLGAAVHTRSLPVWSHILKWAACAGEPKPKVFFCGEWAKFDQRSEFEPEALGDVMQKWQTWAQKRCRDEVSRKLVNNIHPTDFSGMPCWTIPHPSTWGRSYNAFAVNAGLE